MRILAYIVSLVLLLSCNGEQKQTDHTAHDHTLQEQQQGKKYTCSMHPQIIRDQPGTCPICGMTLVEVNQSSVSANELMLNDSQIRLANITTQKVSRKSMGETIVINGTLTVNQENSEVISSRSAGRVEKLYVKETGQPVRQGEPLYVLYSESLLTLQQEYLLARAQYESLGKTEKRYGSFLKAAERKLMLYGLTKKQIEQLTSKDALQARVSFVAPASGIVTEINVSEGQYIEEGAQLYRIEDIGSLWVEAELYSNEASLVKPGDKITVRVSGFESDPVESKVTFLTPEYRANSQILVMRAEIRNPKLRFKPGQHVQVLFTHSAHEAISIPVDAVIRDGKAAHVYVQTGRNTFQPRMVETGLESFDAVEITNGLNEGDTVAVTGAYLLYSEIILKKGTDPMAGHGH